ncbi:hypothetical protein [Chromobacterium sp. IRSSSOUMB001]|uniref:hypothetical protein n=1 Tax=Chromobacterium sp. IRSSSOUMB001 TaxID=2927123 RepID=UPI0020C12015|nr:hypothetical protein [Chromobacterium sp. IRSSSOUMB001]
MINILIRQHLTLKKAAQLILVCETAHGPVSLADPRLAHLASNAELKQELKQTMELYYRWMRRHGPMLRLGGLANLQLLSPVRPHDEAAWATIRKFWTSGRWSNRDNCVRACYKQAGLTNLTEARQALVKQPAPPNKLSWPAQTFLENH